MGLDFKYIHGQTPIDEDEREGLLISSIMTRQDLDEFEQLNIEKAIEWTLKKKFKLNKILTNDFVMHLHKKMFGDVWTWAGKPRMSKKNLGVDKHEIRISLRNLLDDCNEWIQNKVFSADEIAIRFKHKLVSIHVFANGNGRHSRLIADVIVQHGFGRSVFTWGAEDLGAKGGLRDEYLKALRKADSGFYTDLIQFARRV